MANTELEGLFPLAGNANKYELHIAGELANLQVIKFNTKANAISEDYKLDIEFYADELLEIDRLPGTNARFVIYDIENVFNQGLIESIEFLGVNLKGQYHYKVYIVSHLLSLKHQYNERVFHEKALKEILDVIFEDCKYTNFEWQLRANIDISFDMLVQHSESDYEFFQRLISHLGLDYIFIHTKDLVKLNILDIANYPSALQKNWVLPCITSSGTPVSHNVIYKYDYEINYVTAGIGLCQIHPETADDDLTVKADKQSEIEAYGRRIIVNEEYKDTDLGDKIAKKIQRAIDSSREKLTINCNVKSLKIGDIVKVNDSDFNLQTGGGAFFVTEVLATGSQKAAHTSGATTSKINVNEPDFDCIVTLHSTKIAYHNHKTWLTNIDSGVYTAKIESKGCEHAYLNEDGYYKIKFPFDKVNDEAEGSKFVPFMQPHVGAGYGMHFHLKAEANVAVMFQDGNWNLPIILGTIANEENPSSVNNTESTVHRFKSYADNTIEFDDLESSKRIELYNKSKCNSIKLYNSKAREGIEITSKKGKIQFNAGKNFNVTTLANLKYNATASFIQESQGAQKLAVEEADLDIFGKEQVIFESKQDTKIKVEQDCNIEAGNSIHIDADKNISIASTEGDIKVVNTSDSIITHSKQNNIICANNNGDITIQQGSAKIIISEDGNLQLQAEQLELNAATIKIGAPTEGINLSGGNGAAASERKALAKYIVALPMPAAVKEYTGEDISETVSLIGNISSAANFKLIQDGAVLSTSETAADKIAGCLRLKLVYTDGRVFAMAQGKALKLRCLATNRLIYSGCDSEGYTGYFSLTYDEITCSLEFDCLETIDVMTGYPTHRQHFNLAELRQHNLISKAGVLEIKVLPEPIMLNLRNVSDNNGPVLTEQQIEYFKANGNNALVFIHGFNVAAGMDGYYHELDFDKSNKKQLIKPTNYKKSICTPFDDCEIFTGSLHKTQNDKANIEEIDEFLSTVLSSGYYPENHNSFTSKFNGTDAMKWFNHVEYNVNVAAGFDGKDYAKYTRVLRVAWPGDVGNTKALEYSRAEDMADEVAPYLLKAIDELVAAGVTVNIMSHSLGSRLVINCLNQIGGRDGAKEIIRNVFLWQPAVPDTVFAGEQQVEASNRRNSYFPYAHMGAKKIHVLHTSEDKTLKVAYLGANNIGFTIDELLYVCKSGSYKGTKKHPSQSFADTRIKQFTPRCTKEEVVQILASYVDEQVSGDFAVFKGLEDLLLQKYLEAFKMARGVMPSTRRLLRIFSYTGQSKKEKDGIVEMADKLNKAVIRLVRDEKALEELGAYKYDKKGNIIYYYIEAIVGFYFRGLLCKDRETRNIVRRSGLQFVSFCEFCAQCMQTYEKVKIRPALGLNGFFEGPFFRKYENSKYIKHTFNLRPDQIVGIFGGHSYMLCPKKEDLQEMYRDNILNLTDIGVFGKYELLEKNM